MKEGIVSVFNRDAICSFNKKGIAMNGHARRYLGVRSNWMVGGSFQRVGDTNLILGELYLIHGATKTEHETRL